MCVCRFLDDIEAMLGWRPSVVYKYLWKYICLMAMLGLLLATTIRMFIKKPTYMAWNHEKVRELVKEGESSVYGAVTLDQTVRDRRGSFVGFVQNNCALKQES